MSSRLFQGIVLQMKDCSDRYVGVIDADGTVIACNELSLIGEHWPMAVSAIENSEEGTAICAGRNKKRMTGMIRRQMRNGIQPRFPLTLT